MKINRIYLLIVLQTACWAGCASDNVGNSVVSCSPGETKRADDGCNTCVCSEKNELECTEKQCSQGCSSNLDCDGIEYCHKKVGSCNSMGICKAKLRDQEDGYIVCGCDDITYVNSVEALNRGIGIQGLGPCEDALCPNGSKVLACLVNSCDHEQCAAYPDATCHASYCGDCDADFYVEGRGVDCETACLYDADCPETHWCRKSENGNKHCVPYAKVGDLCDAYTLAHLAEKCDPNLRCIATNTRLPDLGGTCEIRCSDGQNTYAPGDFISGTGTNWCNDCFCLSSGDIACTKMACGCLKTGCSNELCAAQERSTTCEWKPEYVCYEKHGVCGLFDIDIDIDGGCAWKSTKELRQCLVEAESNPF